MPLQTALVIEGRVTLFTHFVLDPLMDFPYVNVEEDLAICTVRTFVTLEVLNLFMHTFHVLSEFFLAGKGGPTITAELISYTEVYLTLVPSQTTLVIEGRVTLIADIVHDLLVSFLHVDVEVDFTISLMGALLTFE